MAGHLQGPHFRQFGVALATANQINPSVYVPLITNAAQTFKTGAGLAAGDVKISKDGGAEANVTTLPTEIGTTGIYGQTLTAAEMQASVILVHYKKAGTIEECLVIIETRLGLGQMDVDATQIGGNVPGIKSTGVGTSSGISCFGGATNGNGLNCTGGGSGNGILGTGGPTGIGIAGVGGATSGDGILGQATAGNGNGIRGVGQGTGAGFLTTGGVTGVGFNAQGGATSGSGAKFAAVAGNSIGLEIVGLGTQPGLKSTGGATGEGISGVGGATSGSGIKAAATAGNSIGLECVGLGTGAGIAATPGATGHGIYAKGGATSGDGIRGEAIGGGHGVDGIGIGANHGFSGTAGGTGLISNFLSVLEGSEPTAAIGNNATAMQILQHLKRRFTNKVTQTTTVQTVFRDDSTTVLETGTVSDDGTTQTKNKFV